MNTLETTGGKDEPNIISLILIYIHNLFGIRIFIHDILV